MRPLPFVLLTLALWPLPRARADDFRPDPRTVQRYGPAYRYSQDGWIVMHIEGEPYARGVQHGRLLAPEIAAHVRCLAAGSEDWKSTRQLANALWLRRYDKEYLEEMKGIADGASAAGARYSGRSIDLLDILVINAANELESIGGALDATPNGLEGARFPPPGPNPKPKAVARLLRPPSRCSAFAAVGPATRDGKVVFGHITMWELYPANFYNVWLDLQPSKGHRFVMQTTPGGMHSGMDYSINDAGLMMTETTLDQTGFDLQGTPLASRIRRSIQYADNLEQAVDLLKQDNNGLCTTEWLLADVNRNEIALFTLGTRKSQLYRSSKHQWVAGAEGFYWSCNNSKDLAVRLESVPSLMGRPSADAVFVPCKRDKIWLQMYDRYKGKIDADFARLVLTTPALVASSSVDAKYTTTDLARQFQTWAQFGPPLGRTWQPTFSERKAYSEVRPLVSNPWALLHAVDPAPGPPSSDRAADLHDPAGTELAGPPDKESDPPTVPAWHGTLLPRTDADVWLTTAFANYERIVAEEHALRKQSKRGKLSPSDLNELGVSLFYYRSIYELASRSSPEVPLARTRSDLRENDWHKVASGKGVLLLHSLRGLVGEADFDRLMDEFGRANAGQVVTVAQFQAHLEKGTGKRWEAFFDPWLNRTGLPRLELDQTGAAADDESWSTTAKLGRDRAGPALSVPVTVETAGKEVTRSVRLDTERGKVDVATAERPVRLVVDKYGLAARSNGGPFSILTFYTDIDRSLIVYGTLHEATTNREAAEVLQEALRGREHNLTVPIQKDRDVTDEDLKNHHLLLIGRPDSNALVARFRDALPVTFGSRSFEVGGESYAHPESAVLAAAENPLNRRYSVVVIAGLGGLATLRAAPRFQAGSLSYAEVVVLPHHGEEHALVVPPKELIRELKATR